MRRILRNHNEVAHYWGNEVQSEGEASRIFFENRTIYSYGRHFPIAKHYAGNIVLFTNQSYSVSTSKHISIVGRSIPSNKEVIHCNNPEYPGDKKNLTSAICDIEYNLQKAITARSRKESYMHEAERIYNQIVRLKTVFKIKGWKLPEYDFTIPENVMLAINARKKKAAAKQKREESQQRK